MHIIDSMLARREEFRILRWADTVSVQRNIFIYKVKIILIFAYNKVNINTNNSFYIVHSPCLQVQRILYVYRLYRQTAVSIAKKHLSALVTLFDPNTPKDYNGFLQLLSLQTGHRPVTHASAYTLEHSFPTKLQPDLINWYLVNSHMWHEFTLIQEEDVLDHSLAAAYNVPRSTSRVSYCPYSVTLRTPECVTPEPGDRDSSDKLWPTQTQEQR
jgi:hypothetical protein